MPRGVDVFKFVLLLVLIYILVKRLWLLLINSFDFNKVSLHCPDTKGDFDTLACCYNTGPISRYKTTEKRTSNITRNAYSFVKSFIVLLSVNVFFVTRRT